MKRNRIAALMAGAAVVLFAGALFAQTTLLPGASPGTEVVAVRKYVMITNNANLRDIRLKLEARNSAETVSNARSLASVAMTLPYLYAEAYADAYPVPGSAYSFKPTPVAAVQAAAEYLKAQAEKLVRNAGDAGQSAQQLEKIKNACRDCHDKMRKG